MSLRHFSSESVTEGHPDKVADQISDAVLDHLLAQDSNSRVACETLVTTGLAFVAGEISSDAQLEIGPLVRQTLIDIGYDNAEYGIDGQSCSVLIALDRQSRDIAQGVDSGGAGDQGMMFGYASDETEALLPMPVVLAHRLTRGLAYLRRSGEVNWLRPDGKAQVSVAYEGDVPVAITAVVVSTQHDPEVSQARIKEVLWEKLIRPQMPVELFDEETVRLHVNPTGRFVTGGPQGDVGLTGRKVIVDTYGGMGRHGGGAFSGKDATKVDRSAAYASRWAAKHVVAAGAARRCEIQLAYAIGVSEPVSLWVDTFGTGTVPEERIAGALRTVFDFEPSGIIRDLGLRSPIYGPAATYGHFGREPQSVSRLGREVTLFPWEATPRVGELKKALGMG